MNKKAQEFSPAVLFGLIVVIIIVAPVILKVISSSTGGLFTALNSTAPDAVATGQNAVNKVVNFFDYLIIIGFAINIILLFISAFFIDTHGAFIVLYITFAMILVLLAPNVLSAVDKVWGQFSDVTTNLPLTDFIRANLVAFIVGVIVVSGIIMYAKFRLSSERW